MGKYMVLYSGGMGMELEPEQQEKVMMEWGAWYEKMGPSIVDGGAPFADSKHLVGDSVGDGPLSGHPATGYTVIEADSLDSATAACDGHPHINHGGQIQVFTCIDMSPPE